VRLSDSAPALQQTVYMGNKILQLGFPVFWVVVVRRQGLRWWRPSTAGVVEGLLFGAVVVAGMFLFYFAWLKPGGYLAASVAPIAAKAAKLGMGSPLRFAAGAIGISVANSLAEEYYWRWFLFGGLRRLMPPVIAALASSVAFAAHHVILLAIYLGGISWLTVLFSLGVAIGGAAWAWIYHRRGSLLGPWLSHLMIDAGIFIVGYNLISASLSH
jgi:membrane protease YdiL (CAAX protease family)